MDYTHFNSLIEALGAAMTRWMFIPSMDEASVEKLKAEIKHSL